MATEEKRSISYTISQYVSYLLILCAGIAYYSVIFTFAQNIPIYDDYMDGVIFTLQLTDTQGFLDSLKLIFAQYNQHRIALNRIVYTAIFSATGEINFYTITIIGNLNILILALLYGYHAEKTAYKPLITACCCLLLFQLSYFHTALWPMASLANFSVLSMALLSLSCLNLPQPWAFPLALALAFMATFTLGSGQFLLPCGAALIVAKSYSNKKKILSSKLLAWIILSVIALAIFYQDFASLEITAIQLEAFRKNPLDSLLALLVILGSPFAFDHELVAIFLGGISIGILLLLTTKKPWENRPVFFFLCFLLLTLVILAISRSWAGTELLIKTERYQFVALNYWLCLLLLIPMKIERAANIVTIILLIFALSFSASNYLVYLSEVRSYSREKLEGMTAWNNNGDTRGLQILHIVKYPIPAHISLQRLRDEGKYTPP